VHPTSGGRGADSCIVVKTSQLVNEQKFGSCGVEGEYSGGIIGLGNWAAEDGRRSRNLCEDAYHHGGAPQEGGKLPRRGEDATEDGQDKTPDRALRG
jgi:hypothetical protein